MKNFRWDIFIITIVVALALYCSTSILTQNKVPELKLPNLEESFEDTIPPFKGIFVVRNNGEWGTGMEFQLEFTEDYVVAMAADVDMETMPNLMFYFLPDFHKRKILERKYDKSSNTLTILLEDDDIEPITTIHIRPATRDTYDIEILRMSSHNTTNSTMSKLKGRKVSQEI